MMKKLAVTVFVVSLAAIGCGSDDGTPAKTDAANPDVMTKADGPAAKLDVNVQTDTPMKQDVAPDMADKVDQQSVDQGQEMDGGAVDGGAVDGGTIDGGDEDAPIGIDGGAVDVQPVDTGSVDVASQG
jgi:hypothetical protein